MLECQRHLFDLPEEAAYLNTAYMSPQLRAVTHAGRSALERKSRPYEIDVADFFEPVAALKARFAQLIEGGDPSRVALVPSVSYGMASVAHNLKIGSGDQIVIAADQFPSNVYPWMSLCRETGARICSVPAPEHGPSKGHTWNEALLEAIDQHTRLVSLPHVHWTDGTRFDLLAIREQCDRVGAWLCVDGTQSVGALPFSVANISPDVLVCAGYKWLLGPYSLGLAWYGEAMDEGRPIEENWINRTDSHHFASLVHYREDYRPLANRYGQGESSNFIHVTMLNTALQQILEWGTAEVQAYAFRLVEPITEELRKWGCEVLPAEQRSSHLMGISLPSQIELDKFKARCEAEKLFVSVRGHAVRVSTHLFNTPSELERLVQILVRELE